MEITNTGDTQASLMLMALRMPNKYLVFLYKKIE